MGMRAFRLEAGKTQEEVARALDVALRQYTRWEGGETKPGADNLIALLDYFRGVLGRPTIEARDLLSPPAADLVGREEPA